MPASDIQHTRAHNSDAFICLLVHLCFYRGEWWDPRQPGQSPSRAGKRRGWGTMVSRSGLIRLLLIPAGRLGKQDVLIWHNHTLYSGLVSLPISVIYAHLLNPNWSKRPQGIRLHSFFPYYLLYRFTDKQVCFWNLMCSIQSQLRHNCLT